MDNAAKITLFVALCLGLATALMPRKDVLRDAELSLMRFITQSRDVSNNPQHSLDCFNYYIPLLTDCTDNYEKSYAACCVSADEARSTVDDDTQSDRLALEASANSTCEALSKCNAFESSLDFFACYSTRGDSSMKTMFAISANASDILADVEESYHLISGEQDRCTNASERAFIEEYTNTFGELQSCTRGETRIPASSTTAVPGTTFAATTPGRPDTTNDVTNDATATPIDESTAAPAEQALPEENLYSLGYNRLAITFEKLRKHF